jgi:hypothetical protein
MLGLRSRGGVYRKIESGELETVPGPDGSPRIESDGLIERWREITREQSNSPAPLRPAAERTKAKPEPELPRSRRASRDVSGEDVPNLNDERALHEREKRMLAELARQEKEGELLKREDVTQAWSQAVNLARVKLLGVPSTVKQRIPHLEVEEIEVITGLIREALEELSSGEVTA